MIFKNACPVFGFKSIPVFLPSTETYIIELPTATRTRQQKSPEKEQNLFKIIRTLLAYPSLENKEKYPFISNINK
ncbi:MAG: hypothetical protein ACI9K1_001207 [Arcticibacterium sp.]